MMKRLVAVLVVVGVAVGAQANMVNEGVREFRLQGAVDSAVDVNFLLEAGYGVFVRDFVEVGAVGGIDYRNGGDDMLLRLNGFVERSLSIQNDYWVPYVGGAVGLFVSDTMAASEAGVEAMGYGGMRYYMEDNLAIGFEGRVSIASADIYLSEDDEYDPFDWQILITTRFFY
jgi:hypothetical protein